MGPAGFLIGCCHPNDCGLKSGKMKNISSEEVTGTILLIWTFSFSYSLCFLRFSSFSDGALSYSILGQYGSFYTFYTIMRRLERTLNSYQDLSDREHHIALTDLAVGTKLPEG
jgi:hypothetical protein